MSHMVSRLSEIQPKNPIIESDLSEHSVNLPIPFIRVEMRYPGIFVPGFRYDNCISTGILKPTEPYK